MGSCDNLLTNSINNEFIESYSLDLNEGSTRGFFYSCKPKEIPIWSPSKAKLSQDIFQNSDRQQGISGVIPWSQELADYLKLYLQNLPNDRDWRFIDVPSNIIDIVGSELKRYMCSIEAYLASSNPVMSRDYLVDGIGRRDFASNLKKIRKKSFLMSVESYPCDIESDFLDTPYYLIKDIGDIFNYAYCFFWDEEDSKDYLISMTPIEKISMEDREKFIESVMEVIPEIDEIKNRIVPEEEILLQTSSSSSILKGQKVPVFIAKETENRFSTEPLIGYRTVIPVGPSNFRDSVILSVPHSNSVKLIDCDERTMY
jgi:hypothetical protein